MKMLVIAGHGDLARSVASATVLKRLEGTFPEAEIRRLCEIAPDGKFDVVAEQAALLGVDLIVWQFPFNWYTTPWLMKRWIDEVLTFGFAYGTGAKLGGKKLLVSVTTGAPEAAYTGGEGSVGDIRAFLSIHKATATLCGLDWLDPLWVNGIGFAAPGDETAVQRQRDKANALADRLIERIKSISK